MNWWTEFWAGVQIFFSNFNARFGWLIPTVLLLAALVLLGGALLRALMAGKENRRCPSPLKLRQPDDKVTDHAAESLAKAVAVPTVTGDKDNILKLDDYLRQRYAAVMEALSCAVMSDGSILLRWRAGGKSDRLPVLFCGHLDVVPPGPGWTEEPFSGQRKDGAVHGRGAVDCKATVVALLEACDNLLREGFVPRRDLYFAFGADEETGGEQGAGALAAMLTKRGVHFELVLDEGGSITENHLDRPGHSAALVGVGEKRSCNYKLTATTPGGHSSMPGRRTSVGALAEAFCRIESAQPRQHLLPVVSDYLKESLPAMTLGKRFAVCNMPLSRPFLRRVFRNEPRVLALMRGTVTATQMSGAPAPNILPLVAEGVVNARLLPGESPADLLEHLRALVADLPVRVELLSDGGECSLSSPEHPMFVLLRETLHETFPRLPVLATLSTGATDCRHYASLSDCTLRFTPLVRSARENAGVHGADECLNERSLGLAVDLYMNLMKRL